MNAPNNEERDRLAKILSDTCAKLSEHFECVQIFANSKEDGGDTFCGHTHGTGNYFARYGQIREWLVERDGYMRENGARKLREDIE